MAFEGGPFSLPTPIPGDVPPGNDYRTVVSFAVGPDWAGQARAYHEIVDRQLRDADVGELVRGLDSGAGLDAVLAALFERIEARVRYAGLQFGVAAIVPAPPAETLGRRYGDCKDLSALLVAALRALGIEAHLALVSTGLEPDPNVPGLGFFDHAIVAIAGKEPRFVDATAFDLRGVQLPEPLQGRLALVASPSSEGLVRLPVRRAEDHVRRYRVALHLPERGLSRVTVDLELPMAGSARTRTIVAGLAPEALAQRQQELARQGLFVESDARVRLEPGRPGEPFRMRFEAEGSRLASADGQVAGAVLLWDELFGEIPRALWPHDTEARTHDLALPPFRSEVEVTVVPPPGFELRKLPASGTIPFGPLGVVRTFERNPDGSVVARATLDSGGRHSLTAAEVEAFRGALREFERRTVLLFDRTAAVLLAEGRVREALDEAPLARAIGWAREANRQGESRNSAHLHTLAALLAEAGRAREALDTLRTSLDAKGGRPNHDDDHVAARVAEHLGLREEAIAAYRAIAGEGPVLPNSTAALARRRLAVLGGSR